MAGGTAAVLAAAGLDCDDCDDRNWPSRVAIVGAYADAYELAARLTGRPAE